MHVLFCGDFWQISPFGTSLCQSSELEGQKGRGIKMWQQCMNEYVELTENCRFKPTSIPLLQTFLSKARVGDVDAYMCLQMNSRLVTFDKAKKDSSSKALWLAATHKEVNGYNAAAFKDAKENKKICIRCVATHTPAVPILGFPNAAKRKQLLEIYDENCMTHIDLFIGQQVSVTKNLATQIGESYSNAGNTINISLSTISYVM